MFLFFLGLTAWADPCGMVPPLRVDDAIHAIQRTGAQRTYVMFQDGIETMALRPGFEGDVADFGMLIPFPSPPAIRKIADDTFAHLEGVIEPPKVKVSIQSRRIHTSPRAPRDTLMTGSGPPPAPDEVRVISQEAVGMYQVAVLEAGSPAALKAWMDDNAFRYPEGMDAVVGDYVDSRWCFVAIKAAVGDAFAVTPKPGMRTADPTIPDGAAWDGHVQGMGFRFHTESAVVPMRLSVFNPDATGNTPQNIVYMLTSEPVRIAELDTELVVRQIPGKRLHKTLTGRLALEITGGDWGDLNADERVKVEALRDPMPYISTAKDLFAGDLLAVREGVLALEVEEQEKDLLNISHALALTGPEVDRLHRDALKTERDRAIAGALGDVREMTLTVIDGPFDSNVLAQSNLHFSPYTQDGAGPDRSDTLTPMNIHHTVWR
jgi:hypothetical protein